MPLDKPFSDFAPNVLIQHKHWLASIVIDDIIKGFRKIISVIIQLGLCIKKMPTKLVV